MIIVNMNTACPGNLGTGNIHGGFTFGKVPTIPMSTAKRMKYKGEPSGPRLKQRTVVTEYMTGTKPGTKRKRKRKA